MRIALFSHYPRLYYYVSPTKTLPPIKTPTYSSTYSYRGTRSTITSLTLSLIASTLGATITTTAFTGTRSIRVYLVITISMRINIVYK
jgi:hypothetical protein